MNFAIFLSLLCALFISNAEASIPLPGDEEVVAESNCITSLEECEHYVNTNEGVTFGGYLDDSTYPSGCIRIWNISGDDVVRLNIAEDGPAERDGVAPVCQRE